MTKSTTPSFFRDGSAGIQASWVGPWSACQQQLDDLRKAIAAEPNSARRRTLNDEFNGLLAKAAQANPAGVQPLTFDQRLLVEEREQRLPVLWRVWLQTVDEIMYWTAGDQGVLLEQSAEQFKAAVLELITPLAKAYGADLQKAAGTKLTVTEQLVALDLEIYKLEKTLAAERNSGKRQVLTQQLADLKRKREPLLEKKQAEHATIPHAK
jgi:hypothetical protein